MECLVEDLVKFFVDRVLELEDDIKQLQEIPNKDPIVKGRIELTESTLLLNRELLKMVYYYIHQGSPYVQ